MNTPHLRNFLDLKNEAIRHLEKHTKEEVVFGELVRLDIVKISFQIPKSIVFTLLKDYWCGYATFKKRPLIETAYGGIVSLVPVHGGINYAQRNQSLLNTFTYGFDCAHGFDSVLFSKIKKENMHTWLWGQTILLATSILVLTEYEKEYRSAKNIAQISAKITRALDNIVDPVITKLIV